MQLLRMENLSKVFCGRFGEVKALDNIHFSVEQGEFISITGQSGSGKSTLMNIMGLLDTQTSGEYYLMGEKVSDLSSDRLSRRRNRTIGFIFQDFNLINTYTARQNVMLPLLYRGLDEAECDRRTDEALQSVGLWERRDHLPHELSGGQRQRVAIARVIAADPPLILADEPTGNLDPGRRDEILAIFARLSEQGHTVIIITHDSAVADFATRKVVIDNGRLFRKDVT